MGYRQFKQQLLSLIRLKKAGHSSASRIRTHVLYYAGALLCQLSYEATQLRDQVNFLGLFCSCEGLGESTCRNKKQLLKMSSHYSARIVSLIHL